MARGDRVRLCFVGCGAMARRHAKVARRYRSELALSFASRSIERAREFSGSLGGEAAYGSYEEACASPDVDAVFLCTPPHIRLDPVRVAADAGKAIVLEKPAARSAGELREIIGIVERSGVRCMVAENYHFKPSLRVLRRWLAEGAIGTPLFVEVNHAVRSAPDGWRQERDVMGGGALLEGGVHWVRALAVIGGPVLEVAAVRPSGAYESTAPVEDSMLVMVRFADGAAGKLLHSWAVPNPLKVLEISRVLGSAGTIHFESNGLGLVLMGRRRALSVPSPVDLLGFRAMFEALVPYLRGGGPSPLSPREVFPDYALVDAAYRSLQSDSFEKLEAAPGG
jgi:predicted dehydrogenase